MSLFLLRYGELGLKAPGTRRRYEQRLAENLLERLTLAGIEARIEKMRGRFFAHIAESDDNNVASGVEPGSATDGAAGMDVVSAENVVLEPGKRHAVATGLSMAIPHGYEIQVRPRSGLALKHGVSVPNTPGTIDSDYRGELKVIMINHGADDFAITRGDRIAQLVLAPVTQAAWEEVEELDDTDRGEGGFGSTGGHAKLT